MITTAAFLDLSPEAQREVILDGIIHIKGEAFRLSKSMAKHSAWLKNLDLTQVDKDSDYIDRYQRLESQLRENIDALTEQILVESQKLRHIHEQIEKRKLQTPKAV